MERTLHSIFCSGHPVAATLHISDMIVIVRYYIARTEQ